MRRAPGHERERQGRQARARRSRRQEPDKRAAKREQAAKLRAVQRLTTGANLDLTNTIQAGNDRRSGATVFKFFPANPIVQGRRHGDAADAAELERGPHVHVRAENGKDAYVDQLAANLIGQVIDPRGRVSERSAARRRPGSYTGTNHGNGFYNSGFLTARDPVPLPTSTKVTFTAPGTFALDLPDPPVHDGHGDGHAVATAGGGAVRGPPRRARGAASQSVPVPDLLPGAEIAGCRIEAVAGRGGMGIVYRATQLSLGRPVAVKLIAPERAGDPGFRERFERESRVAAAIDHPNVIPVYAAGEEGGHLYLVMRYVAGTDLQGLLARERRIPPDAGRGDRRSRSARRSTPRTPSGSCTATSSRPTSCSAASTPTSPTSASRS